jgi:hypothetical protein
MGAVVFVVIAIVVVAAVVWNFALRSHGDTLDLNNTVDTPTESAKEPVVVTDTATVVKDDNETTRAVIG